MQKLEFTLKQHTPIIHFQAKDKGATLRASEVKPKLDRFIITEIGRDYSESNNVKGDFYSQGIDFLEGENKNYFLKGTKALDYKMRFSIPTDDTMLYYLPLSSSVRGLDEQLKSEAFEELQISDLQFIPSSPYFANEDKLPKLKEKKPTDWSNMRLASMPRKGFVNGEIMCKYPSLLRRIDYYITEFFMLHNFGARQSKGFGSYILHKIDDLAIKLSQSDLYSTYGANSAYMLPISPKTGENLICKTLKEICTFHNNLKTARQNKLSSLQRYFSDKRVKWEKDKIKKWLKNDSNTAADDEKTLFIRALLGLPGIYDFPHISKTVTVMNPDIERFATPLLYKPIEKSVFIIPKAIPAEVFENDFDFSYAGQSITIQTPPKEDFDVLDFLNTVDDSRLKKVHINGLEHK